MWIVAGVVLAASVSGMARGQDPDPALLPGGLELRAQQGLTNSGGITARWVPVEVTIENRAKGRTVQLVVKLLPSGMEEGSIVARRTITLAPGAKRREWFILPASPVATQLRVEVRDVADDGGEEGRLLRQIEPQLYNYNGYRQGDWSDANILYVTAEGREMWRRSQWLHTYGNQGLIGVRTPDILPDRALAYLGLDMVVLHDADTRGMSDAQRGALQAWVGAGGTVMLVPGKRLAWFNEPLVRSLLGETTVASREVRRLPVLGGRYGPPAQGKPEALFALYVAESPEGRPLPRGNWERRLHGRLDGQPFDLASEVPYGRGRVFVLAADLSAAPFRDTWSGRWRDAIVADLRQRLLRDARSVLSESEQAANGRFYYYGESPLVRPQLTKALNSNREPSRVFVIFLVVIYILVVGPLNYRYLRKRDRQMLLVATVPAISLLFCGAVVLSGYATKGLQTLVWRVTVISTDLGSASGVEATSVSIRSASGSDYRIELDPALIGTQVFSDERSAGESRQSLVDDGRFRFPRVPLQLWEQATFEAFALRDLESGVRLVGRWPRVDVVNGTPWPMRQVAVVRSGRVYVVGSLAVGERQRVSGEGVEMFSTHPVRHTGWSDELALRLMPEGEASELCAAVLRGYTPYVKDWRKSTYVIAVLERHVSEVQINGSTDTDRDVSLLVARERVSSR